jgi:hypothetical protein
MANPPPVSLASRTRPFFRCPLHIQNDLRLIGDPRLAFTKPDGSALRSYKLRKPRVARLVSPEFHRGNKNNGLIEVEVDDEDQVQEDGIVYKLSSTAIQLDFLAKAKLYVPTRTDTFD